MPTLEEQILSRLNDAKDAIVSNIQSKGITASGRTQKAIKVKQEGSSFLLYKESGNNAPMQTLEIGREGGAVPKGFVAIIRQWMNDKGLQGTPIPYKTDRPHKYTEQERGNLSMAGAIAYGKIKNEGTNRHNKPDNTVYSPIIEQTVKDIKQIAVKSVVDTIKTRT